MRERDGRDKSPDYLGVRGRLVWHRKRGRNETGVPIGKDKKKRENLSNISKMHRCTSRKYKRSKRERERLG